jgi:predicted alpha/beta superfamily hydrolase
MKIELTRFPDMQVEGLRPRDVWVWTPPDYKADPHRHFPVIYMHDGQNLFFAEKSYSKVTWGVAEAITRLAGWGLIEPAIVVGMDNSANRFGDYLPTRAFETAEGQAQIEKMVDLHNDALEKNEFVADLYLKLIVEVIKPKVDAYFRTLPGLPHTFVMGSSMGGLISLYALVEYPGVFGGAGCFSPHWPVVESVIQPYLKTRLPEARGHRLYFDYGSEGLDADYGTGQAMVDEVVREKGYQPGQDWLTRYAPGGDHHERAWRSRLHVALRFLLGGWRFAP